VVAAERQLQTMSTQELTPNQAVNLAPFGRWTLRDKAAPRTSNQTLGAYERDH